MKQIDQYAVCWVDLNPTRGAEINKIRPCVVISPVEMNDYLRTIIIAPITSQAHENYPTRVQMATGSVTGWIVLDQIRSVDKTRLCNMEGKLSQSAIESVKNVIREMLVD